MAHQSPSIAGTFRGYPSYMHSAITIALTDQGRIGWLSCLKGFLSSTWTRVATMSMTDSTTVHSDTGTQRLRLIITSLHQLTRSLWLERNESMHQTSNRATLKLTRVEDLEIQHYHERPETLAPGDRHYCERSLPSLLKATPANRRRWLRQVKKARHRRQHELRSQSILPQFFQRLPPAATINTSAQPPATMFSAISSNSRIHPTAEVSHVPLPPPAPPPTQRSILDFFRRTSTS